MTNQYIASFPIPPWETIEEAATDRGIVCKELISEIKKTLSKSECELLQQGQFPININLANGLERLLNIPAQFWINLESQYQMTLERLEGDHVDEACRKPNEKFGECT